MRCGNGVNSPGVLCSVYSAAASDDAAQCPAPTDAWSWTCVLKVQRWVEEVKGGARQGTSAPCRPPEGVKLCCCGGLAQRRISNCGSRRGDSGRSVAWWLHPAKCGSRRSGHTRALQGAWASYGAVYRRRDGNLWRWVHGLGPSGLPLAPRPLLVCGRQRTVYQFGYVAVCWARAGWLLCLDCERSHASWCCLGLALGRCIGTAAVATAVGWRGKCR